MKPYSDTLPHLQQKVAQKKQLEAKLNDLREQKRELDRKVISLRVQHRTELEDVEKLEGRSLANYFYRFAGKLDDKLTEERRQAAAAKVKLDAAERELQGVDQDLTEIYEQLQQLRDCETLYAAVLQEKRAALQASGTPAGAAILELEEQIAMLKSQKREIREASSAGHSALATTERILTELSDADSWNTWDMFGGGGIITHMAKHGHLDDAQELVEVLQSQLRRFQTELADINIQSNMQINIEGFLRFADYFFDSLFADWAVGDRIHESQTSVTNVRYRIESALNKLVQIEQQGENQIQFLQEKIEALVIQAESGSKPSEIP